MRQGDRGDCQHGGSEVPRKRAGVIVVKVTSMAQALNNKNLVYAKKMFLIQAVFNH